MTEHASFLSALKLPVRNPKVKTLRHVDKSKHDAARAQDTHAVPPHGRDSHNGHSSAPQDIWPMQTIMFGLPSVPRAAPRAATKSHQDGSLPALSAFFPAPAATPKAPAPSRSRGLPQQCGLAELEAPMTTWPRSSSTHPLDSSQGYVVAELGASLSNHIAVAPSEPVELCAHQPIDHCPQQPVELPVELSEHHPAELHAWADQPSNKVYNILKAMRSPIQSSRGGYVYCFEDGNAPGQLRFGHTETRDELWNIADSAVVRPDLRQSNTLGNRIRQRKSTCGLWPVVRLVTPMRCAAQRMETLARLTLVGYRKQQDCRSGINDDPEWFNCGLDQAERVLRMWQRFSGLQPFTASGQLEGMWRKYAKDGLRGRWTGYSIDEWVSASWEPMLRETEEGDEKWTNLKGFEPAQRSALQVILGSLGDQEPER